MVNITSTTTPPKTLSSDGATVTKVSNPQTTNQATSQPQSPVTAQTQAPNKNTANPSNLTSNLQTDTTTNPKNTQAIIPDTVKSNNTKSSIEWAKATNAQLLTRADKSVLLQVNPNLAKQIATQILQNSTPQSQIAKAMPALTPQEKITLQQTPLTLVKMSIEQKTSSIISPLTIKTGDTLAVVKQGNQLQLANNTQLKAELQTAIAQLVKTHLPKQASLSKLFQISHQLNLLAPKDNPFSGSKNSDAALTELTKNIINQSHSESPKNINPLLKNLLSTPTLFKQIESIGQQLATSALSTETVLTPAPKSATQLQATGKILADINHLLQTNPGNKSEWLNTLATGYQHLSNTPSGNVLSSHDSTLLNTVEKNILSLIKTINVSSNPNTEGLDKEQNKVSDSELAALIKQLSTQINTLLHSLSNTVKTVSPAMTAIFQLLGISLNNFGTDRDKTKQTLQQQLKNIVEQSSAKVLLNQIKNINLDMHSQDQRQATQQFHGEIPLRFNEQIYPATYQLQAFDDEHHHDQKEEEDQQENSTQKERRWQLFLSLELPQQEHLHFQLTIIQNTLSAVIWAESDRLCKKAKEQLSTLETSFNQAGFKIDNISCLQGKPPQLETSLNYQLVDTKA